MTNLRDLIHEAESTHRSLTPLEIHNMTKTFCKRCGAKTKTKFRRALKDLKTMASYGIYTRIQIHLDETVSYNAGQSYPDEIRLIRKLIIDNE